MAAGGSQPQQQSAAAASGNAGSGSGSGSGRSNNNGNRNRNRRNRNRKGRGGHHKATTEEIAAAEKRRKREEEIQRKEREEEERLRKLELEKKIREEKRAKIEVALNQIETWMKVILEHEESRSRLVADEILSDAEELNPWLAEARSKHRNSKKSLKSDLKKCTAFVKKIKTLAGAANGAAKEAVCKSLVNEIQSLNLSRYIDEIATSIFDAKFKMADVPYLAKVVRAMHERYEEFLPVLLSPIQDFLKGKNIGKDKIDPAIVPKQRRLFVRILVELLLIGVISESRLVIRVLSEAAGAKSNEDVCQVIDATLIVSFAKAAGIEIISRIPRSILCSVAVIEEALHEIDGDDNFTDLFEKARNTKEILEKAYKIRAVSLDAMTTVESLCERSFKSLCDSFIKTHTKLRKLEKRCEQDKLLNGSLTDAREKGLNDAQKLFENLQKSVEALSEVLDEDIPVLEEEKEELEADTGVGLEVWTKDEDMEESDWSPFDDEETWSFYCDVPDFLTTIPIALLGLSEEQLERKKALMSQKYGLDPNDNHENELTQEDTDIVANETNDASTDFEDEVDHTDLNEESEGINKDTPHYKLMVLIDEELPEVHSREKADELSEKFIVNHGSNKNSRKRLVKALFQVPRTRLDLLPYYSRILAAIDRVFDDIASQVVHDLEAQFHGCSKYKKNINLEGRLKNARFIGELTKFRVAPPIVALRGLQRCLEDFSGANIDVACCVLENCGRFLHRTKFTNARVVSLMDTMMRLRKAKNLDDRHQHLIDAAFFSTSPPQNMVVNRKEEKKLPPMEAYLKFLFMDKLRPEDTKIAFISKQLLRLPWNDTKVDCGGLVCKYMLKAVRKGRYKSSDGVALVAEKLKKLRPEIPVRLVDAVFEGIQFSLEQPNFRDQQRTISMARLLGVLYLTGIVSVTTLFEELFHFINFGHAIPDALREVSKEEMCSNISYSAPTEDLTNHVIAEDEEMDEEEVPVVENDRPAPVAVSLHSKFDPRVPCEFDGPTAVLRIKLVCAVLDKTYETIVCNNTGSNNVPKLQRFLAHFQRYLFTKSILPTEVEFGILDLFDAIDSELKAQNKGNLKRSDSSKYSITRYENWADAHAAAVAAEEADAKQEERGKQRLLAQGGDVFESDDEEDDDDDEEEDDENVSLSSNVKEKSGNADNVEDSMSESSSDEESSHNSDSMDEESDETDESEDVTSDYEMDKAFQEEAYLRQQEIEAFERELRKLTLEGLEKGKASARAGVNMGKVSDNMIHASQFANKKTDNNANEVNKPEALDGFKGMSFKVVQRGHKGRVESKDIIIPTESNLAKQAIKQDDEQARERDMIKAKVLQYEADSQEQEHDGNLYIDQTKLTVIRNRPLSLEEIERNFGKEGGSDGKWGSVTRDNNDRRYGGERIGFGGRSGGRGGGRGRGGRTLRTW